MNFFKRLLPLLLVIGLSLSPIASNNGNAGNLTLLNAGSGSGGCAAVWIPTVNNTCFPIFADFSTEGTTNHYTFNGTQYSSYATWATAANVTHTRASSAYVTNSAGLLESVGNNVIRFNYDPVTLAIRGILSESAKTNIALQSQAFGTAPWSTAGANATITANTTIAPDGNTTADTLTGSAAIALHQVYQLITLTTDTQISLTLYAKAGTSNFLSLGITANGVNQEFFVGVYNIATCTAQASSTKVGTTSGTVYATSATIAPNGYCRIYLSGKIGQADPYLIIQQASGDTVAANTYDVAGNITSAPASLTSIIWQMDATVGGIPTSPILTTVAAATRAVDNWQIGPTGGVPFTGWSTEAVTIIASGYTDQGYHPGGTNHEFFDINDGTAANEIIILHSDDGFSHADMRAASVGDTTDKTAPASAMGTNVLAKVAGAFKTNDVGYAVNGVYVGALLGPANFPTVTKGQLGNRFTLSSAWDNEITTIGFAPGIRGIQSELTRLSN